MSEDEIRRILEEILEYVDESTHKPYIDIISEENLKVIENNITFFQDIPISKVRKILIEFIDLVCIYESDSFLHEFFESAMMHETINCDLKPSQKIKKAIRTIENYQALIRDFFLLPDDFDEPQYNRNGQSEVRNTHI